MSRIEVLESKVKELYEANTPDRNDWAGWLYTDHIFKVRYFALELAKKYHADTELSSAAALLHDIADTKIKRTNPDHEKVSMEIARTIMKDAGFNQEEVQIVVDDAIRYHSCRDGKIPTTLVGKILATSDAMGHLMTDFYERASENLGVEMSDGQIREWVLKKIDRDLNNKIFFEDERKKGMLQYDRIKKVFSA